MTQDILPHVPSSLSLVILDYLLRTLTHTSPVRRRTALLLLLISFFLATRTLVALRTALNPPRILLPSPWDVEDALAAAYVPSPPTGIQQASHTRLVSLIESRKSAYPPSVFREAALRNEASPVVGVTAVVLHWKRRKGLELVLRHISRYPFIREVIVWNNRPGIDLTADDFRLSSPPDSDLAPPRLRIVNSPSNVHDAGKHLACSMASFKHCYFNDDDWLNVYLDATYTKYLECCSGRGVTGTGTSGRIASNTLPIIHLEHRRWRFENADLGMHTGFTWLGTGSFAPRHLSRRFMQQQSASPAPLSRTQSLVADMFFSLWTNTYPEQMPNDLVPIDVEGGEVGWSRGEGVDQWAVVYGNIRSAVRTLYTILTLSSPSLSPTLFSVSTPPPESHTRAPCANDGCLFTTSLSPFPSASALAASYASEPAGSRSFAGGRAARAWRALTGRGGGALIDAHEREGRAHAQLLREQRRRLDATRGAPRGLDPLASGWSVQEHESRWNELVRPRSGGAGGVESAWPDEGWWVRNGSWHLAVDGRGTDTCWESFRSPEADDHFGLTLVKPRVVRELTIIGSRDLANIAAGEDLSGGSDAWEVLTVRGEGTGGWEPRSLLSKPQVRPLSSTTIAVTLSLDPIRTPTTYALRDEGNYEVDEEGREVAIRKLKIVSRGRKKERVRVCTWELDGWKI